jgi:mono/diheme cytochrome c family protein
MIAHFKHPAAMVPGSSMPAILLSDSQLNALAAFLLKLNARNADALANAPDIAVNGALVYQMNNCGGCHQVNGVGTTIGPPLNGLARRHPKTWVVQHFANPAALSPGSMMPPYHFSSRDMDNLVAYLFTLQD